MAGLEGGVVEVVVVVEVVEERGSRVDCLARRKRKEGFHGAAE